MPIRHDTPTGSPTKSFSTNTSSPVIAYNSGTPMPESGSGPINFSSAIVAFSGQIRVD